MIQRPCEFEEVNKALYECYIVACSKNIYPGGGQKGKQCYGGKKSKRRVTLAFFVTASGKKEKPVFIWKSQTPRCLRKFDKSVLPVDYFAQKRAWMTGEIMDAVLTKLNRRLSMNNQFYC